jgi:MoaA/NifB/PqqE/SkfB family radical SAM enzyme
LISRAARAPWYDGAMVSTEPADRRARAMADNEALVRRLVAPLHEAGPGGAPLVQQLQADAAEASVYFDYVTSGGQVRVVVENLDRSKQALVHTRSLTVSYQADDDAALRPGLRASLARLAKLFEHRDPGGLSLAAPEASGARRHGRNPLLVYSAHENRQHTWSREKFDRELDAILARGRRPETVIAVVSQPCEMQCVFCPSVDRDKAREDWAEKGDPAQLDDLLYQLGRARALGATGVDLGGNDVLRFSRIEELLHGAGALGYTKIIVQTTGLPLADRAFAEAIAATPATDVHVPIYGATAEVHDRITQTPGTFDRLCRAVDNARALGRPRVRLHTIALASTLPLLEGLIDFCEARFGLHLAVTPLRPNWLGERGHLSDTATLDGLRPLVARRATHFYDEFPVCLFPPEVARRHTPEAPEARAAKKRVHLFDIGMGGEEHAQVTFERTLQRPEPCGACAVREACCGVTGAYLAQFGASELRPIPAAISPLEAAPGSRLPSSIP